MPRDVTATLPDGTQVQYQGVPDSVTPEEVTARVKAEHGVIPTQLDGGREGPTAMDRVKNFGHDLARGAVKNLDTMTGSIAKASPLLSAAKNLGQLDLATPEVADPIKKLISTYMGGKADSLVSERTPEPGMDQYVKAGTEGLGGAMLNPGGYAKPFLNAAAGIGSGVGGRVGSVLTGGNSIGEIIGSLLGGGAPLAVHGAQNARNAPALARKGLEGVSEAELDAARAKMVEIQKYLPAGINLAQATRTPSNITDLVNALAQSPEGTTLAKQLRAQPEQLNLIARVAQASLPGTTANPQSIATTAQDAATNAIQGVKNERTAQVNDLYNKAPQMPATAPQTLSNIVNNARFAKGATPEFMSAAKTLEEQLAISPRTGEPSRAPQDIAAYIRSFRNKIEGDTLKPADPMTKRQSESLVSQLQEALGNASPATGLANKVYSDFTVSTVNPMKRGIVGQIAGVTGSAEDKAAAGNKLYQLFDRGTPDTKSSDILQFEQATRKANPGFFSDAVKSYIADKWNKVAPLDGEKVPQDLAAQIKNTMAPTPAQYQGLKDMLAGAARSQGADPVPVVKGFMNFIDASVAASQRPGNVSTLTPQVIEETAGQSKIAGVLTSASPGRLGGKVASWFGKDARATIDKLLTTPEGLDKLRELAKLDPGSERAQLLVSTFLGGAAQFQDK